MKDIVTRLRRWVHAVDSVPASDLMDEAAAEIERLRSRPCPYVTGRTTQYCTLTPFTLTDEEREAVEQAIDAANGMILAEPLAIETLRGLLSRTGSNSRQTDDNASESGDQA